MTISSFAELYQTRGRHLLFLAICVFSLREGTVAQPCNHPSTRAWVRIEDANNNSDTLWFGFDSTGTCGVDPQLCEWTVAEPCGPPGDWFCIFWYVGMQCAPEGQGAIQRYNYLGFHSPIQIDTFKLRFHPGPPEPRYPIKISWRRQLVSALYDSILIRDYHYGVIRTTPMSQTDSLLITDTLSSQATIIGWYPIVSSVSPSLPLRPVIPFLQQNFPNPFNPSTIISYDIPKRSHVKLVIYDIFGRQVEELVDSEKTPGRYQVTFDASGLPSGVYYYRLEAGSFTETKKLILLR